MKNGNGVFHDVCAKERKDVANMNSRLEELLNSLQKKEEEPDEISLSGEISHLTRIFQDQCRLLLQTTDQIQSLVHDQFLI